MVWIKDCAAKETQINLTLHFKTEITLKKEAADITKGRVCERVVK